MTPERWERVATIYESAVDRKPAERAAFLSDVCAGDDVLRREVLSLLEQDDASVLVDEAVWNAAVGLFDADSGFGPGAALGPYRIEKLLGAGGMGEVFLARDTRLDRQVAIKVLPTGAALDERMRARFAREAKTVAALAHPHVCTLHDVGRHQDVDYIVMEYLDGETLAARLAGGRLTVDLALTYATEIASALAQAHRQGIVHRDLKPANIMLTAAGAKLLDFGLAKFRAAALSEPATGQLPRLVSAPRARESANNDDVQVTRDGTIMGTVRYMPPEQLERGDVDARSDLFSFGAVLFEMLTGKRAFDGNDTVAVRAAILGHEPPPPSSLEPLVPRALDSVVRRCLEKKPGDRWQSADDLLLALKRIADPSSAPGARRSWRWIAAGLLTVVAALLVVMLTYGGRSPAPPSIRSVAVLPLEDLSGDVAQEYFADGMTEQLIADLAAIGKLRVIASTSVMQYRAARKPLTTIARELKVDGIIEGSVTRAGDKVRITAKLVAGATGEVLWAQSFERATQDVLALQRELARSITSHVNVVLTPQEQARLAKASPIDPEVHRNILLGRHFSAKASEDALRRAIHYFDLALAKDANNARAHAGRAEAYMNLSGWYVAPHEVMPVAKQAAETALRLDDSLADAHAALGYTYLAYDWNGPAAEKSLLRALELNPTLAAARLHYSAYLTTQARHDAAAQEAHRAVEFDPASIRTFSVATMNMLFTRRYDQAVELARRGLEIEPNSAFALAFQGIGYVHLGRLSEGVSNLNKASHLDPSPTILGLQALTLGVAGQRDEALKVIKGVEVSTKHRYFCPYEIGTAYAVLGDGDTAYRWFKKGVKDRADCMAWLGVEPWIDPFRKDPRYAQLIREIGLTPSAK
jgi:eukaryotic-like serine/threonine-protein kinase